jgi:hypothetical protein
MMNWAYIAGFFDGEGNINERGHGVFIYQNDLESLNQIAKFLGEQGMRRSKFSVKESGFRKDGTKRCNVLHYGAKREVLIFLNGVLPYLIVKRQRAEDLRRYLILFPPMSAKQASVLGNQCGSKRMRTIYGYTSVDKRGWPLGQRRHHGTR